MFRIKLLLLLSVFVVMSFAKRHVIYWNSRSTPKLLSKETWILEVKIGQFMDILCPQKSLMGITHGPKEPETFDLYNVTGEEFDNCDHGSNKDFIFACDRPEQENKLTIKFQLISPSPLGFRFQYCQDYYFVAIPRVKDKKKQGCQTNVSTRLHISVGCKDGHPRKSKATTTTSTMSTTTPIISSTTSTLTKSSDEKNLIIPDLVSPSSKTESAKKNVKNTVQRQTGNKRGPGGSSQRCSISWTLIQICLVMSLYFTHFLTTDDHVIAVR